MVEDLTFNQVVEGSSPSISTKVWQLRYLVMSPAFTIRLFVQDGNFEDYSADAPASKWVS